MIAPGADRLDVIIVFAEGEFGANRRQPFEQRGTPRDHKAGMAAQHLRFATRQMKLVAADIDPHIGVGHHQIGIARQPEPGHIEQCRQMLVGDLDVDVFEVNRIAKVFCGAVEFLLHGCIPGCVRAYHRQG